MTLSGSLSATVGEDAVRFTYEVENEGDDSVSLQFSDAQTHDVVVRDGDEEVWRFSGGRMFAQMLQSETVDAGDSLAYEAVWDSPSPGKYDAEAFLAANDADATATTTVSV
jgi:hypothetical protein